MFSMSENLSNLLNIGLGQIFLTLQTKHTFDAIYRRQQILLYTYALTQRRPLIFR